MLGKNSLCGMEYTQKLYVLVASKRRDRPDKDCGSPISITMKNYSYRIWLIFRLTVKSSSYLHFLRRNPISYSHKNIDGNNP